MTNRQKLKLLFVLETLVVGGGWFFTSYEVRIVRRSDAFTEAEAAKPPTG